MTETIRYTPIGTEDIRFGTSSFEVTLADGRVVSLSEVNVMALIAELYAAGTAFRLLDSNGTLIHAFGAVA